MYNDEVQNTIINNLKSKELSIVKTTIALNSQGYIVNKSKYNKLYWINIFINAFENINVFDDEQQHELELLYNKLMLL